MAVRALRGLTHTSNAYPLQSHGLTDHLQMLMGAAKQCMLQIRLKSGGCAVD